MVEDAILTCLKRGADKKAVRCWYKLNETTKIRVKTGAGLSGFCEAGALVGQGTLGGALISQGVLDEGIKNQFLPGDRDEMNYGDVPLAPMIFQDDVIHLAGGISEARLANIKIDRVVKRLNLRLNQDKTTCLIMGSRKQMLDLSTVLDSDPLYCGNFQTDRKPTLKWLGQTLSSGGLSESVAATVTAREGKIRGACLEISQIVNDWRSKAAGGMETALLLWESCCIPSLLNGAGTWTEITSATVEKLNQTQSWFLRLIFQIGQGAPLASLLWDSGFLDIGFRIYIEKIMLVMHIRSLEENTLANQIYEEQKKMHWPGLATETFNICLELNIEDCNSTMVTKSEYRKIVIQACHRKNEEKLRALARGKCDRINHEEYGKKTIFE